VLSLFDSIEANRDDIDIKENVRAYLKSGCSGFERLKKKQKLDVVYRNMAAYLAGRPGGDALNRRPRVTGDGTAEQHGPVCVLVVDEDQKAAHKPREGMDGARRDGDHAPALRVADGDLGVFDAE
jgi:hypothetical protein